MEICSGGTAPRGLYILGEDVLHSSGALAGESENIFRGQVSSSCHSGEQDQVVCFSVV